MKNKNSATLLQKKASNKKLFLKMISTTSLAIGSLAMAQFAYAANVENLILSGNKNVNAKTVFANLELKKGDEITNSSINASIASLHSTGLFKNVNITSKGNNLYVKVVENPSINTINFAGNKNLATRTLENKINLRKDQYFTKSKVEAAVAAIKKHYVESRYSNVEVSYSIKELGNGKADITFNITEGASTTIQKISFVGNSVFSDGDLKGVIKSSEKSILNFFSNDDAYSAEKLAYDQELLRRYYLEHGYADFSVISAVADLDDETNKYFLTFTIDEGEPYKYGEVDVDSAFAKLQSDDLLRLVKGRTGGRYNAFELNRNVEELTKEASRKGYSFANVTPVISRNAADKTIDVVYVVEGGERVYIDRINITGNVRTHDKVIRREVQMAEGDAFNPRIMARVKARLMRLGHFTDVKISTEKGSDKDRLIINVNVAEKPTGSVGISGAYSTLNGLVGELSYGETNLLGSGQRLNASLKWSSKERSAEFGFTEPFFMDNDFSVGVNAFAKLGDENDGDEHLQAGGGLTIGLPVGEFTTVQARYNYTFDENRVKDTTDHISAAGFNVAFDTRDDFIRPTEGVRFEADVEYAGLGGNVKYIRAVGKAQGHYEIVDDIVLSAYAEAGTIKGHGGEALRQQDTFFKGGELVRGFDSDGLGPRVAKGGDAQGGKIYAGGTVEISAPISKSSGLYAAVFADAGTLYDSTNVGANSNTNKLRSSVGASVIWNSPFGPLRADYAYVLNNEGVDDLEPFKFGLAVRY